MDPEAALTSAASALMSGETQEARQYLDNYKQWRLRGGFEPSEGDIRARQLRRKAWGKVRPLTLEHGQPDQCVIEKGLYVVAVGSDQRRWAGIVKGVLNGGSLFAVSGADHNTYFTSEHALLSCTVEPVCSLCLHRPCICSGSVNVLAMRVRG